MFVNQFLYDTVIFIFMRYTSESHSESFTLAL